MFEGLFQPMHLLVIFGIALLVFGPKKLPELGKGIGEGIRGFKSAMKEQEASDSTTTNTLPASKALGRGGVGFGAEILFIPCSTPGPGAKRLHMVLADWRERSPIRKELRLQVSTDQNLRRSSTPWE
jgi:sec-independent protein translocase protein TatA